MFRESGFWFAKVKQLWCAYGFAGFNKNNIIYVAPKHAREVVI